MKKICAVLAFMLLVVSTCSAWADESNLLESFAQNEAWLTEHLDGKAKEHLLELINIHDELDGAVSYGSFREGFIIGASLVMEAIYGQTEVCEKE